MDKALNNIIVMGEDFNEVVNDEAKEFYGGRAYIISIKCFGFRVYADCENEALEILGRYCKGHGYTGLIEYKSYDELLEECDGNEDILNEEYYPVNGGEFYLSTHSLNIIDAN